MGNVNTVMERRKSTYLHNNQHLCMPTTQVQVAYKCTDLYLYISILEKNFCNFMFL